ncbi:MAG: trypsin-like peptidase domain-containing protein [Rubrivivax sp.]|nr:trypsin-like peptidase domain-containing protein [Rubrivivax sp.]
MSRRRVLQAAAVALSGAMLWPGLSRGADDTTFYSGPELGAQLLRNVVRIRSQDFDEHGFGLVVAVQMRHVLIATARHVVVPRAGAEPPGFDPSRRRIEVSLCAGDDSGVPYREAELETGFEAGGRDIALLRVTRPAGYAPLERALAAESTIELRQEAWLLGQEQQCGVAPRSGAMAAVNPAQQNLRIEFPGVRGGASGGPAISGYGVLGLITNADDLTFTVLSIASLEARVRAQANGAWALVDARNIPPGDPRAAEVDLAETLNQFLFNAHNLQGLLLQPNIPKPLYVTFARDYNAVMMNRYALASERHDGTLRRYWPETVFTQWQALRVHLWSIHEVFRALNAGDSKLIFDTGQAPPEVQDRMRRLEPELLQLRTRIAEFLHAIGQRAKP